MEKRVSRTLLYFLVFVTPFIFVQNTNEVFEFPKMHFVYIVGSLVIIAGMLEKYLKPNSNTLTKYVVLFVLSFIISTIFSSHPYTSLWGYYSRFNGGLASVLIYFGIFLTVSSLVRNKLISVERLLKAISFTVLPISIYAILQHFELGGIWATDTTVRAFSTFGQPNWYGAYCAMVLPLVLFFGMEKARPTKEKIAWLGLFILGFFGFWYSYSLSGIAGLSIALLALLILNPELFKKNIRSLVIVGLICTGFAVFNPGIFAQKIKDAFADTGSISTVIDNSKSQQKPVVTKPVNTHFVSDSGYIRTGLWAGTFKLWKSSTKNILVGTGPETFPYEFQKFRPASLNYSSEWNYVLNKPHNYYLELLAQNGIIGLVLYLTLIFTTFKKGHKILTPALTGLLISDIFGWPTVYTSLLFWIFLGIIGAKREVTGKDCSNTIKIGVLIILGFLNYFTSRQYQADISSKQATDFFDKGNVQKALTNSNRAVKLNPYEPYYLRERAKIKFLELATQDPQSQESAKDLILEDLLQAFSLNPNNLITQRGLVPLYYFLSLKDISKAANSNAHIDNIHKKYLIIARDFYLTLGEKYPNDAGVITLLIQFQAKLNLAEDGFDNLEKVRMLRPDLLEWYL